MVYEEYWLEPTRDTGNNIKHNVTIIIVAIIGPGSVRLSVLHCCCDDGYCVVLLVVFVIQQQTPSMDMAALHKFTRSIAAACFFLAFVFFLLGG